MAVVRMTDRMNSRCELNLFFRNFYTVVLVLLSLCGIVYMSDLYMPTPLMTSDEVHNKGSFIAERAKLHVTHLSNLGPRPVGSLANEVLAIKYLTKTLSSIQAQSHSSITVEIDQQVVSGEFPLQFLDGLNSVYRNIQNVVVRVSGKASSGSALLLNCHYDSVVDSPGTLYIIYITLYILCFTPVPNLV